MCAKRISKEQHDAFENDIDLDLASKVMDEKVKIKKPTGERREKPEARKELIERVRPSEMKPDRFQPRPIMPIEIQGRFFAGEIDCYHAAAQWLELADKDKGHRSRIDELVSMADSVREHGQIKPITGKWETAENGDYFFRIETGERRFWGACLKKVIKREKDEPLLRIEAVKKTSVERQIVENRHAEPPTAVAQAREIAALLLKKMGFEPDLTIEDPYAYFRKAISFPGRRRLPRGIWGEIEPVMQVTPRRMRQILSILRLPTELLEVADRYDLSDRVMQAVLAEPTEQWAGLINIAVEQSMTGEEIAAMAVRSSSEIAARQNRAPRQRDNARSALRGLRGFSGALSRAGGTRQSIVLGEVADEIVIQEDAANVLNLLEELTSLVRTRLHSLEDINERK